MVNLQPIVQVTGWFGFGLGLKILTQTWPRLYTNIGKRLKPFLHFLDLFQFIATSYRWAKFKMLVGIYMF